MVAIDRALHPHAGGGTAPLKIMLLLRLSPLVPFAPLNYLMYVSVCTVSARKQARRRARQDQAKQTLHRSNWPDPPPPTVTHTPNKTTNAATAIDQITHITTTTQPRTKPNQTH
jgi:hypothetical protein